MSESECSITQGMQAEVKLPPACLGEEALVEGAEDTAPTLSLMAVLRNAGNSIPGILGLILSRNSQMDLERRDVHASFYFVQTL